MLKINRKYAIILAIVAFSSFQTEAKAASISMLGTASNFGVLGGSTVTNTGPSVITESLGVSTGSSATGFPPAIVNGTIFTSDTVAAQAQVDNATAYNKLASLIPNKDLTGLDLGGLTLTPGVYSFSSSAQLTGILTLDNLGDPNALFVFQIGSTLTTASNSSIVTTNGDAPNVFFQIGSSATLGTGTQFMGNILALTSITLTTGVNIDCGRALAQNGAVTMDTNKVSNACYTKPQEKAVVPEPDSSLAVLGSGLVSLLFAFRKRFRKGW
uniref:Ice-binding protein n=1 Tax=Nostoc sp. (strain HG1) TaxID=2593659 RepID=IBP_NOSSH|nr:RecName: Full=Ice-binding protein; Short=nIBP; Flags: Precursor [Nostoc sp. HG1]QLF98912.1 ice-binding protein [Nostoc sp. HG1]